jgi:hypothetical protein
MVRRKNTMYRVGKEHESSDLFDVRRLVGRFATIKMSSAAIFRVHFHFQFTFN